MIGGEDILLTGGTGRLGTELRTLLSGVTAPTESEMDIVDPQAVAAALDSDRPKVLVHCAAYTDVAGAERDKQACWRVNVAGTRNVVAAAAERGVFLVHISTDYVFEGKTGMYKEQDPLGPVGNYYALSKLVAEELVRFAPRHLVVRTSFRPRRWPYPTAFTDVFTSQDYVDVVAPMVAKVIRHCLEIPDSTLHVATERKSAFDLARRRRSGVRPSGKSEAKVHLPDDTSLDVSRWLAYSAKWSEE